MMDFITKLQGKSEGSRRLFLVISSCSITLIVAFVWGIFFFSSFLNTDSTVAITGTSSFEAFKSQVANVKDAFNF